MVYLSVWDSATNALWEKTFSIDAQKEKEGLVVSSAMTPVPHDTVLPTEDEFDIEKIYDKTRVTCTDPRDPGRTTTTTFYFVKWPGESYDRCSWEPAHNLLE